MTDLGQSHQSFSALLGWGDHQNLEAIADLITTQVRLFLQLDRVMVYRFDLDGHGQVIAECVDQQRLPSMLGLHFPASDIPGPARQFLLKTRQRVIVDVASKQKMLLTNPPSAVGTFPRSDDIRYSPVDNCHLQYLLSMGVLSSITYSLVHQGKLWGLLVGHHSESRQFSETELQTIQIWVDQFSVALAQERLRQQVRQHQQQETLSHQLRQYLEQETSTDIAWEKVLQAIAGAFGVKGCRLSFWDSPVTSEAAVYTDGVQPVAHLESAEVWSQFWDSLQPLETAIAASGPNLIRVISEPDWQRLGTADLFETLFQPVDIKAIMVVPLRYHEEIIGHLSLFRQSQLEEITWAGQVSKDPRNLRPRTSFAAWQEQRLRVDRWTGQDYALAQAVARHITTGIMQHWVKSQLAHNSARDAMTHLPNWMLFTQQVQLAIWQSLKQGTAIAVGLLNLNQFRRINTLYGQTFGNYLMRSVAHRLSTMIEQLPLDSDIPPLLARWHGDQFALLIPGQGGTEAINRYAQAVLDTFTRPFALQDEEVYLTASLGIAVAPYDGDTTDALIQQAAVALDQAKSTGSSHYQFYSHGEDTTSHLSDQRLANDLYRALIHQELKIHYQPQGDLKTGQIVGVEALVRWQHPQLGLISPDRFIPLAEETGLIGQLDEWVLRTACLQYRQWRQAGILPMRLAVNVSAKQFQSDRWVELVKEVLQDTPLAANELELEITEATLMKDVHKAVGILKQLKALGVQIALDDFGTGYSSLSMLKHFPIDRLKVDRSFIRNSPQNAEDAAIVQTIMALGQGLKLTVVAEGVETAAQLDWLTDLNCDHFQGYYLAHPQLADNLATWLQTQPIAAQTSVTVPPLEKAHQPVGDNGLFNQRELLTLSRASKALAAQQAAAAPIAISSMATVLSSVRPDYNPPQEHLLRRVTEKIRQSLHLDDILPTIVEEIRHLVKMDRVILYKFADDWTGQVVQESVSPHYQSLIGKQIVDKCFAEKYVKYYRQGRVRAIDDIETADIADCHRDLLRQYQVRANLVMPIAYQDQLWGLLIAHHCQGPRPWLQQEVELLGQLAVQAAIAIHQGELYQQLELSNRELKRISMLDQLTQVANRHCFDHRLQEEWQRSQRSQMPLSLLFCDIDYFKNYNDTYGHPAGDRCLQMVAKLLRDSIKRPGDLIARYGGEEFVVILPETDCEGAYRVAQKIQQSLQHLQIAHGGSPLGRVTLSIGVAGQVPESGQTINKFVQQADRALYNAKTSGRDRIQVAAACIPVHHSLKAL